MLNRKNNLKNETSEMTAEKPEAAEPETEAKDLEFAPGGETQPGTIEDREGYEAAIHSGTITEIPDRNIVFVGDGEPPLAMHGAFRCELPDAETQKRSFYHADASRIIKHFPKKYKRFQKLGDV